MIKSMTGFASASHEDAQMLVGVTLRAVNHRFLDLQFRLPPAAAGVEPRLRARLQERLGRGRVELTVSLQLRQPPAPTIELNEGFARALGGALDEARARGLVTGVLTPGDLLRLPQALVVREGGAGHEGPDASAAIEAAVEAALAGLDEMRAQEGAHLAADFAERLSTLAQLIEDLARAADQGRQDLERRLLERVGELAGVAPADPAAVAQEVVRVAQRSDISEEVTRFRAHLAHWAALTSGAEPCGRKLDFLLQEMNREINTIGSKADGVEVPALVIRAKAELERLREQVQNVE